MLTFIDKRAVLPMAGLLVVLSSFISPRSTLGQASPGCRVFPETGKQLCGYLLNYWSSHGGLTRFGFPLSEQADVTPGSGQVIQYFERAVFMPRTSSSQRDAVVPAPLGADRSKHKHGGVSNDNPLPALPYTEMPGDKMDFWWPWYPLSGAFLRYWQAHGGAGEFGYPISPLLREESELDGNQYIVQYFEGAVFEYHPENAKPYDVLLSQLGTLEYKRTFPEPQDILHGDWCGSSVQINDAGTITFGTGDYGQLKQPVVLVFGHFEAEGVYGRQCGNPCRDWPGRERDVHYIGKVAGDVITFTIAYDFDSRREGLYNATKGRCP